MFTLSPKKFGSHLPATFFYIGKNMAVNGQNIFNNDYSFLNLPEVGSDVRSPINTFNLPPNIVAAINKVAPIKLPEMDTPLNFDPFDPNVNNEGLIGAENFSEFLKQMKEKIKFDIEKAIVNKDPIALIDAEEKMEEIVKAEEGEPVADPVADPIIDPVAPYIPQPTPIAQPTPISQPIQPQPAPSFIDNELESLSNPTAAMYSRDVGTGGSMGLGSPMAFYSGGSSPITSSMGISGSMSGGSGGSGFSAGVKTLLGKAIGLGRKAADIGIFGPGAMLASKLAGSAYDKYTSNEGSDAAPTTTITPTDSAVGSNLIAAVSGGASEDLTVGDLLNELSSRGTVNPARSRLSRTDARGDSKSSGTMGFTKGNFGPGATKGGLGGGKSTRGSSADMNAAMTAGIARDKGSAMNTLYGGAGSSFESGRNEYTESGQYDIDREARQAEFDAMRAGRRKLTPAETQQAVLDQQERIGFGGVMTSAQGRDNTPLNMDQLAITDPVRFNAIIGAMNPSKRESNNPSPFMGIPGQGGIRSIRRG